MTRPYSNSCEFNTLVLNFMALILLRSTDMPRMVTSSTGISVDIIITKLTWPIKQLKPIRSSRLWHIVVIEKYLILSNIITGLRRTLMIWHMLDLPMRLMNTRRF